MIQLKTVFLFLGEESDGGNHKKLVALLSKRMSCNDYEGRWNALSIKKWEVSSLNKERATRIAEQWGIPYFLAMMLDIRGITEQEEIERFLKRGRALSSPFLLKDMDKAVERIRRAIDGFEKICIYGDYDADGVTSTALLYSYLESVGADVMYYIPDREKDGYGMNVAAVERLAEMGVRLIITVDNGIASVREVERAGELKVDVVVTDHHQPQSELPPAVAVVDPHREDCPSPFKPLAGVGVAFKLVMALESDLDDVDALFDNYADLAAIGTIGDVVPLEGENRVIAKQGLQLIENTDRIGLKALLEECGMAGKKITAGNVAFTLVPRINATGRIGTCDRSVRLLLSDFEEEAQALSSEIGEENRSRQQIEQEILAQAQGIFEKEPQHLYDRVLVVAGEGWHHGVIGIVSARLTERYGKPSIVIAIDGEEAKGSGRSIEGFSLCDAVFACKALLTKYGGHPMAAGLSLKSQDIEAFRQKINEYARNVPGGMPYPKLHIDCKLNPAALSASMVDQLVELEPFGAGNPTPVFGLYSMKLESITPVGGGKHLRLQFTRGPARITAMKFSTMPEDFPFVVGDTLDLAVTLDKNEYRGETSLSIFIKEMKPAGFLGEHYLQEYDMYESYQRGEPLSIEEFEQLTPSREDTAAVYRFLRKNGGWHFGVDVLQYRLQPVRLPAGKIAVILDMMEELRLIKREQKDARTQIVLCPTQGKVDLFSSKLLLALSEKKVR